VIRAREALAVDLITVGADRITARVRVVPGCALRTSAFPGVAAEVLALMPDLVRHRCECGSAHGIAAELVDTELPHLLEHVTLELMARAGSPRSLRGETTWDFAADGRGVFRVALEYDDDLVALAALREGAAIINGLIREHGAHDVHDRAD
jgi:hypothetical protein